ncbi:NAD(P)H-dependent flavin oxidoreductase YrpB (nitropropane dioxygenase family) [Nocardioides aromaticivorans]|uniref:Propionate 3-nitronate monooxygenase n=1 Tax=Nocardioides aromaticivorans TaxID=200618 RepID=A0A7Y9ZIQ5_9ACTN|nr:nitronate monooxygenase [Nocardioides aromaticivorans]NYI44680.1 NAD(P)H-dependent flavin oxidoreductase YrpB (nitropropane dioxygenase family) [Nocardioides aromaticivorans]
MSLLDTDLPIIAAPMAGGPTTVALATAVTDAGGFSFLPAGYLTAAAFESLLGEARAAGRPFGVNLFVPQPGAIDPAAYAAYRTALADEAAALGVDLPSEPRHDDDAWGEKVDLLVADPVPLVSLTFGLPAAADIRRLQAAGSRVLATVTTPDEARAAEEAGVDGLVVQGPAAGGHSGTFDPRRPIRDEATGDVVRSVRATSPLPVLAGGGVDGPAAVHALLAAGAEAVAVGTLLLRAEEAGTSATHRATLADPAFATTVVTHAFTGRPARALRNGFVDRHGTTAPYGYPELHHLTRDLRRAAAAAGDPHRLHLWAGTGHRSAVAAPAAEIVRGLV